LLGSSSGEEVLGGSINYVVAEDTFVRNDRPDKNYGQGQTLEVDNEPHLKSVLLRFHVDGIPAGAGVKSATLRLFVIDGSDEGGEVRGVEGEWSEASTTWANAPAAGASIAAFSDTAIIAAWKEVDVTPAVPGNGDWDLYIVPRSHDGVDYASRERGTEPPTLVVEWSAGVTPRPPVSSTATPASTPTDTPGATPSPEPTPTPTPTSAPTPPPQASGSEVLVGAGDIADCEDDKDEKTAALLDGIGGTVFTTGDNAYISGTAGEYRQCYDPSWGRHKARTRPSAGNHEYLTEGASGYFGYFGASAGEQGKGYYSYDLGEWHVVVLNANCWAIGGCGAGSAQEQWLRADLAAHPAACTLAYWHQPRFSSGSNHGGDASYTDFWQALYDYNAEVVVNGHEHNYERFAPQAPDGSADAGRGIREFVVGTGGKVLYPFGDPKPNSEVRSSDTFGVLKLTLSDGSYDWEFVPVVGATFRDEGSGACH